MQSCKDQHAKQFSALEGKVEGKECLLFAISIWPCSLWTQLIGAYFAKADLMEAFKLALMMYVACFAFSAGYWWNVYFFSKLNQGKTVYSHTTGEGPESGSSYSDEWSGDGEMPEGAWQDYSYSEPGAEGPKGSWSK